VSELSFSVIGTPGPQGSKSPKGRDGQGRAILVESSKLVRPWRDSVAWHARDAMAKQGGRVAGPVRVSMTFTVPKPKSAPKRRQTWPDRKPDISKLARSTEDALVTAGAIEDDARIVGYDRLEKVYPNEGIDALDVPGFGSGQL
jgi:Holliday junction resolvase RusA-like endonuclease